METTAKSSLSDKIINGLKNATVELEEFRLQAALGKAEARDVYEDVKKKFNTYTHEAKIQLEGLKEVAQERSLQLKTLLETLQVQLALGKAETKEAFETQRKKIEKTLNELEELIRNNKTANEYYTTLLLEIGKFRIKLEILKLRFELKKLETRVEFDNKKKDLLQKISDIKTRFEKRGGETQATWEHFRDEITEAYAHLKNALVK